MKHLSNLYLQLFLFFLPLVTNSQHAVQTLVPQQVLQVGESFQVQFISNEKAVMIKDPDFGKNFRLISGPRMYQGVNTQNNIRTLVQNFSYTLVPLRKGRLVVKGATFVYDDKKLKCSDAIVIVQPAGKPPTLPVLTSPWEQEVFIEAVTNKKECFVGEPVVATFTLFSRLSSAAEVIKNPGFYGFSVVDIPQASEYAQSIQSRSGSFYNTHVLRKVQLYPVQPGKLVIDEMTVNNTFEEIHPETGALTNMEKLISSEPMAIQVKALPRASKTFAGAVGNFLVYAYLITDEIETGKTGKLVVTLSGKGNFLQVPAPEIDWPAGVEVYNGPVTEALNSDLLPVEGNRKYEYNFTADSVGNYTIRPIQLTFFHPAEKRYKTVSTDTLHFTIRPAVAAASTLMPQSFDRNKNLWVPVLVLLALVAGALLLYRFRSRPEAKVAPAVVGPGFQEQLASIRDGDYLRLQQLLNQFLKQRFGITTFSKTGIVPQLKKWMTEEQLAAFMNLWEECERVQYYHATPELPFSMLRDKVMDLLHDAGYDA